VPTQVPPSLEGKVVAAAEPQQRAAAIVRGGAKQLMWVAAADMAVFFVVLLVGFAYVWHRGDLDWVRAYGSGEATAQPAVGGRVS
jgi:NADH-quinone oxidoreductase subunit A